MDIYIIVKQNLSNIHYITIEYLLRTSLECYFQFKF